ncbi:MAG: deoxyribodipyrimidine photolyase [Actinomycetota bacterium]
MDQGVIVGISGLIISIVCAIVCASLAGSRNRHRVVWAILGFFFPIIALIVLLIIGKKQPSS